MKHRQSCITSSIKSIVIQSSSAIGDLSLSEGDKSPSPFNKIFAVQSRSPSDSDANRFMSSRSGGLSSNMPPRSPPKSQAQRDGFLAPWGNHGLNKTQLNIQGLNRYQFSPSDMYKPVVRVYPAPYGRGTKEANVMDYLRSAPFLEYIDVTTSWKGMSLTDAEVLFQIHQVFKASLESVLVEHLRDLHQQFQQESSRYHTDDVYSSTLIRQMNFSRVHLMQTIIWMLRPRRKWDVYLRLLPLYLSTCDCLQQIEGDESQATAIEVRVCYNEASWYLSPPGPVAEPAWIPDRLDLGQIQQFQREGQELIIMPYYYTHSFSGEKDDDVQISYSITSCQPWLSWDDSIGGFKGTLPTYSELQGRGDLHYKVYPASPEDPYAIVNILRVDIKALVTKGRLSSLRLERTLRARLTFKIIPRYEHIGSQGPSDGFFRPLVPQFPTHAFPTISWASSESLLNRSNLPDDLSRYSEEIFPSSKLDKRVAQTIETENCPPMHVTSSQNSRKRRVISGDELTSPNKRHRETTKIFSMTKPETTPDGSRSTIDRALPFDGSNSYLSTDCKQILDAPPLLYFNRVSPLCDLELSDGVGYKASSYQPTDSLDSGSQSLELTNKIRKCISAQDLSIDTKRQERKDSGYFSKETVIEGDRTAETSAYNVPAIKKRSKLTVLLKDVSHSIDAIAREKLARLGEGQYCSGSSDSSSRNSELSSRKSSNNLLGVKKRRSPKGSPRRCSSSIESSSIDMILEDSSVASGLRREQALLWKALSAKMHGSPGSASVLNVQERKEIYEAMKISAEEEQKRRDEKIGLTDVFDDLFVDDSNDVNSDEEDEMVESSSEQPEPLSEDDSGLGSVDQGLEDSVNYGF